MRATMALSRPIITTLHGATIRRLPFQAPGLSLLAAPRARPFSSYALPSQNNNNNSNRSARTTHLLPSTPGLPVTRSFSSSPLCLRRQRYPPYRGLPSMQKLIAFLDRVLDSRDTRNFGEEQKETYQAKMSRKKAEQMARGFSEAGAETMCVKSLAFAVVLTGVLLGTTVLSLGWMAWVVVMSVWDWLGWRRGEGGRGRGWGWRLW